MRSLARAADAGARARRGGDARACGGAEGLRPARAGRADAGHRDRPSPARSAAASWSTRPCCRARELLHRRAAGAGSISRSGPSSASAAEARCGSPSSHLPPPIAPGSRKLVAAAAEPLPVFRTLRLGNAEMRRDWSHGEDGPAYEAKVAAGAAGGARAREPAGPGGLALRRRACRPRRRPGAARRSASPSPGSTGAPGISPTRRRRREDARARHAGARGRRGAAGHDFPGDDAQPSARRGDLRGGAAARGFCLSRPDRLGHEARPLPSSGLARPASPRGCSTGSSARSACRGSRARSPPRSPHRSPPTC